MTRALTTVLLLASCVRASQKVFSVNDDVFAYPQYEIDFSPSYVLESEATDKLYRSRTQHEVDQADLSSEHGSDIEIEYEQITLHERRYLCSIPQVKSGQNVTEAKASREDVQKELVSAADRGWKLLQDMEGKQCLFASTGWWSYSFCYNSYVKQFHSLPPAPGAGRVWPPQEDQTTPSYILGRYDPKAVNQDELPIGNKDVKELRTRADGNYLIQRLEGGTACDLTGKNRRVEIEFHCHPQTTDRIGWIKETTTCAYLMVIYTPRLCNDVAFQPPRDSQAHTITCQEILTISEATDLQQSEEEPPALEASTEKPTIIGNIAVGGMKFVVKDGKKLERGKIVMTAEEKAETIIYQKDGHITGLSRTKMKELNLEPEDIEEFKRELQKIAGSKDWKIERLGDGNGQIQLRGIVSADGDGKEEHYEAVREGEETEKKEDSKKDEL